MLGAIIGDIVGSIYEWKNIKIKEFELFGQGCHFTDDTVMTLAIAKGIMAGGNHQDFIDAMKELGRYYPKAGYGGAFRRWLVSDLALPYNSWGNGSAMRVSAVAWAYELLIDVELMAKVSAEVTHNHPEGIKGAQATAACIWMASHQYSKVEIKEYISDKYGYDLNRTLNDIRQVYVFNESCQATVPEAIIAFLESNDFEDAIRNAISLGGDSDTLAAITGSIAQGAYGIPILIANQALSRLDQRLFDIYEGFMKYIAYKQNM